MGKQFSRFLEMFKKIKINIPFAEALAQMPNYTKFLKDILSKKKKFAEEGVVNLTATYSVVIQRSLPMKMQDPWTKKSDFSAEISQKKQFSAGIEKIFAIDNQKLKNR